MFLTWERRGLLTGTVCVCHRYCDAVVSSQPSSNLSLPALELDPNFQNPRPWVPFILPDSLQACCNPWIMPAHMTTQPNLKKQAITLRHVSPHATRTAL